ncbi:MAG: biliverdin-producing heme oxygenase [Myxococcota bacterium]
MAQFPPGSDPTLLSTGFAHCGATVVRATLPDGSTVLLLGHVSHQDAEGHLARLQQDLAALHARYPDLQDVHVTVIPGGDPEHGPAIPGVEALGALPGLAGATVTVIPRADLDDHAHLVVTRDGVTVARGETDAPERVHGAAFDGAEGVLVGGARFRAPPVEAVWAPSDPAQPPAHVEALALAVDALLAGTAAPPGVARTSDGLAVDVDGSAVTAALRPATRAEHAVLLQQGQLVQSLRAPDGTWSLVVVPGLDPALARGAARRHRCAAGAGARRARGARREVTERRLDAFRQMTEMRRARSRQTIGGQALRRSRDDARWIRLTDRVPRPAAPQEMTERRLTPFRQLTDFRPTPFRPSAPAGYGPVRGPMTVQTHPAPSLHLALRAATADAHEAVEAALPFGAPDLDPDRYLAALQALRRFVADVDASVPRTALPWGPWLDRAAWLAADVAHLDGTAPPLQPRPLPADGPEALGVHYVLEGSALGATVLYRRLREQPWLADGGLAYFGALAERAGPRWKAFREHLAAQPADDHAAIVRGAVAAFGRLLERAA